MTRMPVDVVDVHAHLVPDVDDGARTLAAALELVAGAAAAGTRVQFCTPHLDERPDTAAPGRLARIRARFDALAAAAPADVTLRLGYEVLPSPQRLAAGDDPGAYRLAGTEAVLVEGPAAEPADYHDALLPYLRKVTASGLTPVLAHPERRAHFTPADPHLADRAKAAGALLAVDGGSLTGLDGPAVRAEGIRLLRAGLVDLIASDAHGGAWTADPRPGHRVAVEVLGAAAAARLYDGSALPGFTA